jgi:hypothetical protein
MPVVGRLCEFLKGERWRYLECHIYSLALPNWSAAVLKAYIW